MEFRNLFLAVRRPEFRRGAQYYDASTGRWITQDHPSGKDIVIIFDPVASPGGLITTGHPAILIGNDETGWRYFSFHAGDSWWSTDDNLEKFKERFPTLEGAKRSKSLKDYADYIRYKASKEQDQRALDEVKRWEERWYDLVTHNCALMPYWATKRAGIQLPRYRVAPLYTPIDWWRSVWDDAKTNKLVIDFGKWNPALPPPFQLKVTGKNALGGPVFSRSHSRWYHLIIDALANIGSGGVW